MTIVSRPNALARWIAALVDVSRGNVSLEPPAMGDAPLMKYVLFTATDVEVYPEYVRNLAVWEWSLL